MSAKNQHQFFHAKKAFFKWRIDQQNYKLSQIVCFCHGYFKTLARRRKHFNRECLSTAFNPRHALAFWVSA
jgi:hypothetical protein